MSKEIVMPNMRLLVVLTGILTTLFLVCSPVFADSVPIGAAGPPRPGNQINVGDAMNLSVGSQQGAGAIFQMSYPGLSQPVQLTARITGAPVSSLDNVGIDVYDDENPGVVVEHTTLARNQLNNDANLMEVAFSSNVAQTVTFQIFNWTGVPVTVSVQPVQLPAGPLTLIGPTFPGSATPIGISGVTVADIPH